MRLSSSSSFCRPWIAAALLPLFLFAANANAARVLVIGDSLSAEYDALPDVPGIENPTEYARVTVPGWESMSWVEVLGKLRSNYFDFGRYRSDLPGWSELRFTGYEFNFAIPGFTAAQYAQVVESSIFSNPQFLPVRLGLESCLRQNADWVVIGLGGNEFRAKYSYLYEGGDAQKMLADLTAHVAAVVSFVQRQKPGLRVILLNVPDLGATPSKKNAHPDPAKRARVSGITVQANQSLANLAQARGAVVADLYESTRRLIAGEKTWFGPVDLIDDLHPDNDPRYHFTREGLHPNTGSQLEVARAVIAAANAAFGAAVPQISDREALAFLKLDPDRPYQDWIAAASVSLPAMDADPDADGLPNLVEYSFGTNPGAANRVPAVLARDDRRLALKFMPDPQRTRHVRIWPQASTDLVTWTDLPATQVTINADNSVTALAAPDLAVAFLRLHVSLRPVE